MTRTKTKRRKKLLFPIFLLLALLIIVCVPVFVEAPSTPPVTPQPEPNDTIIQETPAPPKLGWIEENGLRYYYAAEDVMSTGWVEIDERSYYFLPDGSMATGKVEIDGQTRFFAHDGSELLLANPWNFIPEDHVPEIVCFNGWQYVSVECYDALMSMLDGCREAGLTPYVASAYRTHGDQRYLYNNKIQRLINEGYSVEDANKLAGTVVAVPGTSEHELGLALDLVDYNYRNLDEAQENTPVQQWFMAHCWEYGFILRYPNDKSDITGIIYEPWHYRYVGKTIAEEIYKTGVCLEEYLDALTREY